MGLFCHETFTLGNVVRHLLLRNTGGKTQKMIHINKRLHLYYLKYTRSSYKIQVNEEFFYKQSF